MKDIDILTQLEQTESFINEDVTALWLIYDRYFAYEEANNDFTYLYNEIQSDISVLIKSMQYNLLTTQQTIKDVYLKQKK